MGLELESGQFCAMQRSNRVISFHSLTSFLSWRILGVYVDQALDVFQHQSDRTSLCLRMSHFDGAAALKLSSWYVGNAEAGLFPCSHPTANLNPHP